MSDKFKTLWIGVFIIAAIVATASLLLFLEPTVGDEGKTLRVRFSNIEKISIGTRVTFAGKPVGEVVKINEIFDARNQPADELGNIYFYELVLKIDSSVDVYNTDIIVFQTSGLLGEKSIAIVPRAPKPGSPPAHIVNNEVLYARSTDKVEEALNDLIKVAGKLEEGLDRVIGFIDANSDNVRDTVRSIQRTSDDIGDFFAHLNQIDLVSSIKNTVCALEDTVNSANMVLGQACQSQLIPNFAEAAEQLKQIATAINQPVLLKETMRNLRDTTKSISEVVNSLACGEGTLGKLLTSDEFYLRLNAVFDGVEGLLGDVRCYGLLFNYDKKWQRKQARQRRLMQCLDSADNFYTYFNVELQAINQSIDTISCLLETNGGREASCCDPEFMNQFYTLLKKVNELQSTIQLYNQAIVQ